MSTPPQKRLLRTQEIHFPDGHSARAVFLSATEHVRDMALPELLRIEKPDALIALAGGAGQMDDEHVQHLEVLFTEAIVPFAVRRNALLIDGGTHAGVMQLLGNGVAKQKQKPTLLGISPTGQVNYPGKAKNTANHAQDQLDFNHSHFILVEADDWGSETEIMYATIDLYAQHVPSVAILINGGRITKTEALYNVRQQRPIIVIEGSGRCADEILQSRQKHPETITDQALAEIVQNGKIHPFPLNSSAKELVLLLEQILG